MINGWFSRLSLDGRMASGQGQVYIGDRLVMAEGYKPQWFDAERIVAMGAHDWLYRVDVETGVAEVLTKIVPAHVFAAGAAHWAVRLGDEIALTYDAVTGNKVRTVEYGGRNEDRSIFVGATPVTVHVAVGEARMHDDLIVFTETARWPERAIVGIDLRAASVHALRVTPPGTWSGHPIPIRTATERWVLVQTNTDLRLYPWGATRGYIIRTGENRNLHPDAVALGRNVIRVVWNDAHGGQTIRDVNLGDLREDVTVPGLASVAKPPPPPPPPPKDIMIPSELQDDDTIVKMVSAVRDRLFPDRIGQGLHDGEKAAIWAKALAWDLKQRFPHLAIGLAAAKGGSENHGGATADVPEGFTTDIIAISNGAHWDFQIDGHAGVAAPTWALEDDEANYPPIAARFVPAFAPDADAPDPVDIGADVAALRRHIAALEAEIARLLDHSDLVSVNGNYAELLATIDAADAAFRRGAGRPVSSQLVAHLCSRFIILRYPPDRIIEEARLRGAGLWTDQW